MEKEKGKFINDARIVFLPNEKRLFITSKNEYYSDNNVDISNVCSSVENVIDFIKKSYGAQARYELLLITENLAKSDDTTLFLADYFKNIEECAVIIAGTVIKDYLEKQIELHKNDKDFDEQYNEAWVDGTTKLAIEDGFNADVIVKWAEHNETWPSIRNLAHVIWCLETYQ